MTRYLIVGNGVAGTTAAEHLRKQDAQGEIALITDEDLPFYWRIQLNDLIAGEIPEEKLLAKSKTWYDDNRIRLVLQTRMTGADPQSRTLTSAGGETYSYDTLLLATGSHSFVPPVEGSDKDGVLTLRNVADARSILSRAEAIQEVVLIGGGLLGLEAGNALRKLGKQVTVVEFFPRLLPRQLDEKGAARLQSLMEGMGFVFRLGAKTQEITGTGAAGGVRLEGGEELSADMVLISAGVRPNLELAQALSLDTDKGVQVDERLRTSRLEIFAAGDVAEFRGMSYGIWPAAMEQGRIAGTNMAGGDATYQGTTMANSLKVVGIDLASAGDIDADGEQEAYTRETEDVYQKVVFDQGRVIGCIMLGDTTGFNRITKAMQDKMDVSALKDRILNEWAS